MTESSQLENCAKPYIVGYLVECQFHGYRQHSEHEEFCTYLECGHGETRCEKKLTSFPTFLTEIRLSFKIKEKHELSL